MKALSAKPHPNVVQLVGVALQQEPFLIITELCPHGDLLTYVRKHQMRITLAQQISLCADVAAGMAFLASKGFIHRDLSARNCLVGEVDSDSGNRKVAKVADFGLSREVSSSNDYYRKLGSAVLPVRWMAPESLSTGKFDAASDVWSFGVLVFEVFSFGKVSCMI